MRGKPDILWILVILFGLGVVTTGYAQSFWERKSDIQVVAPQVVPNHQAVSPLQR